MAKYRLKAFYLNTSCFTVTSSVSILTTAICSIIATLADTSIRSILIEAVLSGWAIVQACAIAFINICDKLIWYYISLICYYLSYSLQLAWTVYFTTENDYCGKKTSLYSVCVCKSSRWINCSFLVSMKLPMKRHLLL